MKILSQEALIGQGWVVLKKKLKKEKESEENWSNWAFRPIMERLLGKGLEHSEGTSSIAQ